MKNIMNLHWNILSKYRSELMGIAILWIMAFHMVELKHNKLPAAVADLYGLLFHGYLGVEIFLLLSGMGLYYSFKKNARIRNFYVKRLHRILLPYAVVGCAFWGFHDLIQKGNAGGREFIEDVTLYSFWSEGERVFWFIALIIPLYLVWPLIFKAIESRHFIFTMALGIGAIYVGLFFLREIDIKEYIKLEIALTRISSFLLGGVIGRLSYEKASVKTWMKLLFFGTVVAGLYAFDHRNFPVINWKAFRGYFFLFGVPFIVWFSILMECFSCEKLNRFLRKVGGMSLELYLVHVAILHTLIRTVLYKNTHNGLWVCVIIVCVGSLLLSYVLHYHIFPVIYRRLERI